MLMIATGGLVLWALVQGQDPLQHLRQLVALFGHQHLTSSPSLPPGLQSAPPAPPPSGPFPGVIPAGNIAVPA